MRGAVLLFLFLAGCCSAPSPLPVQELPKFKDFYHTQMLKGEDPLLLEKNSNQEVSK